MKTGRILEMERYIIGKGTAGMEELQAHFGVSANTVRRDVAELLQRGTVEKVYGGVCARQQGPTLTHYDIRRSNLEEVKTAVAKKAASLVTDGDVVFIDSGTTTLPMIDFLAEKQNVTVITHNLGAVNRAMPYENLHVIVLPGSLRRKTNSTTGSDSVRALRRYNIRLAFMAATGLSRHGATNSSPQEYDIKQCAVENSEKVYLLVDSHKFGVTGMMTYADIDAFDGIVTDREPDTEYTEWLREMNVPLFIAGNEG